MKAMPGGGDYQPLPISESGRGRWYSYRSTSDKLSDHLNSIEDSGDEVVKVKHVGGRDWLVLCRKAVER